VERTTSPIERIVITSTLLTVIEEGPMSTLEAVADHLECIRKAISDTP